MYLSNLPTNTFIQVSTSNQTLGVFWTPSQLTNTALSTRRRHQLGLLGRRLWHQIHSFLGHEAAEGEEVGVHIRCLGLLRCCSSIAIGSLKQKNGWFWLCWFQTSGWTCETSKLKLWRISILTRTAADAPCLDLQRIFLVRDERRGRCDLGQGLSHELLLFIQLHIHLAAQRSPAVMVFWTKTF